MSVNAPLLSYKIATDPELLQAGRTATLIIEVSNDTESAIHCKNIIFDFLAGDFSRDLFPAADGIGSVAPNGWAIRPNGSSFVATPDTPADGNIVHQGLTFSLTQVQVNEQTGTTDMTITEKLTNDRTGTLKVELVKFPLQFKVGDFKVDPPNITEGESTTLFWAGSANNTYELQYMDLSGDHVTISETKGEPSAKLPAKGSYTIDNLPTNNDARTEITFSLVVNKVVQPNQATVTVAPLRPKINFFEGRLRDIKPGTRKLVVEWETINTKNCYLTGDDTPLLATSSKHPIQMDPTDDASQTFTLTASDGDERHSDTMDLTINWRFQELKRSALGAPSDAAALNGILDRVMVAASREQVFITGMDTDFLTYGRTLDATTLEPVAGWDYASAFPCIGISANKLYAVTRSDLCVFEAESMHGMASFYGLDQNIEGAMLAFPPGYKFFVFYLRYGQTNRLHNVQYGVADWPMIPAFGPVSLDTFVDSVTASPVEPLLYFGCDRSLRVMNVNNAQQWIGNPITLSHTPKAIVCAPDGKTIFLASDDNTLSAITADTFELIGDPVDLGALPTSMAISPNGEHLYVACNDGTLRKMLALSIYHPGVSIKNFTATPVRIDADDDNKSFPVQLDWQTVNASKTLLNDQEITGPGTSVVIDKTTQFTLKAIGGLEPVSETLTVEVIHPVRIDHFTASAGTLYRTGDHVDVTLDWAVKNAVQVTLNGETVTGNSKKVSIQQTTTFRLAATGKDGPVTSDVTVVVKQVNLVVSRSDGAALATFSADAGTYAVKFVLHYYEQAGIGYFYRTEEKTVVVTSAGDSQSLSAQVPLNERFPRLYCLGADITVTGLPCGPVTAAWGKKSF